MKKSLLAFSLVLSTIVVSAQINKGTILLGGSLAISTQRSSTVSPNASNTGFSLALTPSIGYVHHTNRAAGVKLLFTHEDFSGQARAYGYGLGTYFRRYLPVTKDLYLTGQADIDGGITRLHYRTTPPTTQKGWNLGLAVSPGLSYAVKKYFHVEVALGRLAGIQYTKNNNYISGVKTGSTSAASLYGAASGTTQMNIGFRFLL